MRSRISRSKGTVTYCQINGSNYLNSKIQVLHILWLSSSTPRYISEKLSYVPLEYGQTGIYLVYSHYGILFGIWNKWAAAWAAAYVAMWTNLKDSVV